MCGLIEIEPYLVVLGFKSGGRLSNDFADFADIPLPGKVDLAALSMRLSGKYVF